MESVTLNLCGTLEVRKGRDFTPQKGRTWQSSISLIHYLGNSLRNAEELPEQKLKK